MPFFFPNLRRRSATVSPAQDKTYVTLPSCNTDTTTTAKKKVSFDFNANQYHATTEQRCPENSKRRWYQKSDYNRFFAEQVECCFAIRQSQGVRRDGPVSNYRRLLVNANQYCRLAESHKRFFYLNVQGKLTRLYEDRVDLIGLERMSYQDFEEMASWRRCQLMHAILELQEGGNMPLIHAESIRKACERISRPDCLFAAMIASAQANACTERI